MGNDTNVKQEGWAGPPALSDRYVALELDLGKREVVIYDRENTEAWIQSDYTFTLTSPDVEGRPDQ